MKIENYQAKDSLLSGPAGGVVGAAFVGDLINKDKLITFDMGGTSTDVSRFHKSFDYKYELEIVQDEWENLVMELDNVIVIVAIDQRVALASLAQHYEELAKHHLLDAHDIARDYLAKVIHIPIVLEQPSATDIEHYLTNHLWKNNDESEVETNSEKDGTDNLGLDLESESNSVESTDDVESNQRSYRSRGYLPCQYVLYLPFEA